MGLLAASLLLSSGPAWADGGAEPTRATAEQRRSAEGHFFKGRDLFKENKPELALAEFRASWGVVASPNARLFVARCLRDTGKLQEASAEYERTADDVRMLGAHAGKYAETQKAALTERAEVDAKLAAAAQEKPPPAPEPGPPPAGPPAPQVALAPAPVAEAPRSGSEKLRPYAYVAGGLGVLGLATFAVAGAMEKSTYAKLQDTCHGVCPPSSASDISAGRGEQLAANVGLAVGLVGAVAGVTLFVLSMPKGRGGPAAATSVVVGPGFLGVRGTL